MIMIKSTTVKKENSCVKIGKRGVSVFLAVLNQMYIEIYRALKLLI